MDKGPWVARNLVERSKNGMVKLGWCVASEDFRHDVTLQIHGDFADEKQCKAYAEWLADKLNRVE